MCGNAHSGVMQGSREELRHLQEGSVPEDALSGGCTAVQRTQESEHVLRPMPSPASSCSVEPDAAFALKFNPSSHSAAGFLDETTKIKTS